VDTAKSLVLSQLRLKAGFAKLILL
jgi:hypothetical protein